MRAIRSEASIEGGTNSTVRIRLSSPIVSVEVDIGEVERAGDGGFLRRRALLGAGVLGDVGQHVADVDHAARDRRASRHRPACANGRTARTASSRSPSVVSISTASMSARGTITSSTRTSRSRRMLLSIARSPGEKDSASVVGLGQRVGEVLAEAGAVAAAGTGRSAARRRSGRSRSRARRRPYCGLGPSSVARRSCRRCRASGRAAVLWSVVHRRPVGLPFLLRVGIGNGKPRQRRAAPALPSPRPPPRSRGRGRADAGSRGPRDG